MKTILTTLLVLLSLSVFAGGKKYQQKMGEALSGYAQCQTAEDFQALANRFQLIARAEKKEWLPHYYRVHCLTLASFMTEDPGSKDALLDQAEESLTALMDQASKESEAHALQSFFYTARLVVDPATRGQQYSAMSGMAVGKALKLDPQNPRARYIKLSNDMGRAQFFGQDPSEYCGEAEALLQSWDAYQPESPLHPTWGKDLVAEIVENCQK